MPTTPAFESLSLDALATITGGCKKRSPPPAAPPQEVAPTPAPSGPLVSTNVSVTGYGAPTQQTA